MEFIHNKYFEAILYHPPLLIVAFPNLKFAENPGNKIPFKNEKREIIDYFIGTGHEKQGKCLLSDLAGKKNKHIVPT